MSIAIRSISYELPANKISNENLLLLNPELDIQKLEKKIGLKTRYYVDKDETATDLAIRATRKLLFTSSIDPDSIDFILLCTQSPDYFLPPSSCIIHKDLGFKTNCGALDFNLGCSGYVYGLSLAKSLMVSNNLSNIILITAETYSKYVNVKDKVNLPVFGDAATATLLSNDRSEVFSENLIGPFEFYTEGKGFDKLIVPSGCSKYPKNVNSCIEKDDGFGNIRSDENLYMNGYDIFNFTISEIPKSVASFMEKHNLKVEDIDYFVFHQANEFMLKQICNKLKLPQEKFYIDIGSYGNTVSSTIPLALHDVFFKDQSKELLYNKTILICGFGVGLSWAVGLIKI